MHSKRRAREVESEVPSPEPVSIMNDMGDDNWDPPPTSPDPASSHQLADTPNHHVHKEATSEDEEINLPVETGHHSLDSEDRHMRDGPHPLSLLSDVGSRLRTIDSERPQHSLQVDPRLDDPNFDIGPGWTSAQLRVASARKRYYFEHTLSSTKRDTLPSLDPISKGLLTEDVAEELVRGSVFDFFEDRPAPGRSAD